MLAKSFVVAMAADIARSDYAKPTLIRSRSREWLIACRWGSDGEYLSIATAGAILDPRGLAAPDAIAPVHSLFGVLVAESETEAASTFCQCANCPFRSSLRALSFPPMATRCCSSVRPSAWSPKPVIRTAAAGWTAGRSARTFLTRRRPRRRRWHGTSRRSGAIGLASSSRGLCARKARHTRCRMSLIAGTINAARFPGGTSKLRCRLV